MEPKRVLIVVLLIYTLHLLWTIRQKRESFSAVLDGDKINRFRSFTDNLLRSSDDPDYPNPPTVMGNLTIRGDVKVNPDNYVIHYGYALFTKYPETDSLRAFAATVPDHVVIACAKEWYQKGQKSTNMSQMIKKVP